MKGSIFNKVIHAETIEMAVLGAVKSTLMDTVDLRQKLLDLIAAEAESTALADVEGLKAERERLKRRTEFLADNLDEENLADAKGVLEKLKVQRRQLDEQIAAASVQKQTIDAEAIADAVLGKIDFFSGRWTTCPSTSSRNG